MKREASILQHQQQQQRETNLIDRANELALDNLNVIYDNDTEHIELSQAPASPADGAGAGGKAAPNGSFVHGEHGDEAPEQQDNYATCPLDFSAANAPLSSSVGRMNFWQPIKNRGALHLLARLRYEPTLVVVSANQTGSEGRQSRLRRESFQTLIERVAPSSGGLQNESATGKARPHRVHRLWLLDDCGSAQTRRSLFAELKSHELPNATVDLDAELVLAKYNLTEPNSIIGKCLQLEAASSDGDVAAAESASERNILASCTVLASDNLPPVSELEHVASVSQLQPVREELLFGSSPTTSTEGSRSSSVVERML